MTFLSTVAFRATKIPTTLRTDVPVAFRATKKLEDTFDVVGMYTLSKDSIRLRKYNKGKRKRNKKVNSRNSVEESSYEHIGLSINKLNESFLSESSDTLINDLVGLRKQRLTYPKNWS